MLRDGEILIDDDTEFDKFSLPDRATGLIPRDYNANPPGYLEGVPTFSAVNFPLISPSEWSARIKEMVAQKSRLSDIRLSGNAGQPIPSLDQGQWGYCWAHSPTSAVMAIRAVNNQPYVPLSAFSVAAPIKNGRNEGGWGAQALERIQSVGVASQAFWPQQSANLSYGTAACWANAALHKVTEGWVDLDAVVYNRNLSFAQVMTLLLCRIPVVGDFNWWGHSVCLLDPVEVEPGSFGVRIWNSWGDGWGDRGMGVLRGDKAIPDGAVAPRAVTASVSKLEPALVV